MVDCFFFLQGTCSKGDGCEFRHSEIARLNPSICKFWLASKCKNPMCGFKHPPIPAQVYSSLSGTKDKSKIPCYYETQPSGCQKDDCPYLHSDERSHINAEDSNVVTVGNDLIVDGKEEEVSTGVDPQVSSSNHEKQVSPSSTQKIPNLAMIEKKEVVPPGSNEPKRKVITIETRKPTAAVVMTPVQNISYRKQELKVDAQVKQMPLPRINAPRSNPSILPPPSTEEEKPAFGVKSFVEIISEKKQSDLSSGCKRMRETTTHPAEPLLKLPRQDMSTDKDKSIPQSIPRPVTEESLSLSEDQFDIEYEEALLNGEVEGTIVDADNIDIEEELAAAGVL